MRKNFNINDVSKNSPINSRACYMLPFRFTTYSNCLAPWFLKTIMKKLSKTCKMHPNTLEGLRNACLGTHVLLPKKISGRKAQLVCLAIQTIFFFKKFLHQYVLSHLTMFLNIVKLKCPSKKLIILKNSSSSLS